MFKIEDGGQRISLNSQLVKRLAGECGFELAGVAAAVPHRDFERFEEWRQRGFAGEMTYLTDRRGDLRADPRNLLESAASIICVGKVYNTGERAQNGFSSYAWGSDYHRVVREGLNELARKMTAHFGEFQFRACVDTAPLLERSYAEAAGLGWIGKNTMLINQQGGSWFFLGELLVSLSLEPDAAAAYRCGTCTRCIDACPTNALSESGLDARLCISYLTIEKRGLQEDDAPSAGSHLFGCDICQEVCPWNGRAWVTEDARFHSAIGEKGLEEWAALTQDEFRTIFRNSPVYRAKYRGFLRNVAAAAGTRGLLEPLRQLALHPDSVVAETARRALVQHGC